MAIKQVFVSEGIDSAQLGYLREVLGINSILATYPQVADSDVQAMAATPAESGPTLWQLSGAAEGVAFISLIPGTDLVRGASAELLRKMLGAMNLNCPQALLWIAEQELALAAVQQAVQQLSQLGAFRFMVFLANDEALPWRLFGRSLGEVFRLAEIPALCTWHPDYLLINENDKRVAWQHLKLVMKELAQ